MRVVIHLQRHLRFGADPALEYGILVVAVDVDDLISAQMKLDRAAVEADIATARYDAFFLFVQFGFMRAAVATAGDLRFQRNPRVSLLRLPMIFPYQASIRQIKIWTFPMGAYYNNVYHSENLYTSVGIHTTSNDPEIDKP